MYTQLGGGDGYYVSLGTANINGVSLSQFDR